ncbi:NAD(P)/FAD-dependent oxidoreductase [Jatrophihabitans sp.]|uniref:NAD(P)/FAD-dependent oxidoreductase n=1 Tax=Jatrophihabitans sp. TaxID=1932789 RepID=UPI002C61F0E3|nr:FAD-dependent oxidoreductase [Jatrophihabitans sp.]
MPDASETSTSGTSEPDVLVVGGGVAGLWCAYFLASAGRSVTVLDQAAIGDPAACSSGNTGFLGAGGVPLAGPGALRAGLRSQLRPDDRLALPPTLDAGRLRWLRQLRRSGSPERVRRSAAGMLALKRRSWQLMAELPVAGFTAGGMLHAYRTQAGFDRACSGIEQLVAAGVPMRALTPAELAALEPDVEFAIVGALFNPDAGFFDAPAFSRNLAAALAGRGVEIRPHTAVTGVRVTAGRVCEVHTGTASFRPAELVLAAGSWTPRLAAQLGLELPVQPVKGYAVTAQAPAAAPRHPVLLSEGTVAVRPLDGGLRFAGDLALAGPDTSIDRRRVDRMLAEVRAHLPALEPADPQVWVGLRPCTPDSLPLLGRAPGLANVTVATGHGHNGMSLAPAAGELVAQLLTDQDVAMDALLFEVGRFSSRGSA